MICLKELRKEECSMKTTKPKTISVELTEEQQYLFLEFMKRADVIGHIIGFMDSAGLFDMKNASITLDIDKDGIIQHTTITRHFRR